VAAADFAFADPGTEFSLREARLGLIPATVAPFVLQRTGLRRARQLMLGGQSFGAAEALDVGIIDRLVPRDESGQVIDALVSEILKNAPEALAQTKKLLLEGIHGGNREEMRELCTRLIARKRLSAEAREGIAAFFEKRKPAWEPEK
jgi:methylglutaconyl-CoA hydratase